MDEPISNLDAKLRERTRTEMKRLLQRFGITTLYVTHDQQEAIFMGDRIVIMRAGRLEQFGTFDELYYSPTNLFVATFIGTPPISLIPAVFTDGKLVIDGTAGNFWEPPAEIAQHLPTGPLRIGIRPEGWQVENENGQGVRMDASHVERLYTERAAFVYGRLAGALVAALVPLNYPEVKAVSLTPQWDRAYFFEREGEKTLHVPGVPELF
jgi:ABC-type sugar transport system ATPase subunit